MRHYLADLTGSTEVLGTLTASNLMYPSSDGTNNQVIRTDGSGRLTFTSTVDSASHAEFADDATSAATATTASYVSSSNIDGDIEANSIAYSNITGVPAGLVSGSTQITALGFISESFSTAGTGILSGSAQIASEISGAFTADSASFSSSIASLETFSASLDATFATEAELNSATQSLSQSIAADIEDILDGTSTVPSASNAANATSASYIAVGNIDGDITADSVAYTNVTGIPAGIVSSSTQITAHGFISESFSTAGTGILSGSAQIASEISGAFTSTSSSLAATIEDIEDGTTTVPSASLAATASYVNASNIDGSITADSIAFTNITGVPAGIVSSSAQTVANLPTGTVSSSAQITAHGFISESFSTAGTGILSGSAQIASDISGSLGANATLIRSLTAAGISGSLGANATLIRSLTAASISGSFNSVSASIASDIAGISDTDVDVNVSNLTTRLGQITGDVSVGGASSTVTIPGNLTVQGTRTELQVSQLNVEDTLITVASGAANAAAADGAGLYISGANESFTWDNGNSRFNISDDLHVDGTLTVPQYIQHNGDTDTYIQFAPDIIQFYAGNARMLTLTEGTQDEVVINENSADIDFRVESNNNAHMLFVDAGNDRVGIGTGSASDRLHVNGRIRTNTEGIALSDTNAVIYRNSNDLELRTYAGYDINLIPANNVGVGTTSPSFKLDVAGTASAHYFTGSFVGDGSALTGLPAGYSVTNEANNRIVTSTGAAAGNAEANLTYGDTNGLVVNNSTSISGSDTAIIVQSKNSSATGAPQQFFVQHDSGATRLGNARGDLHFDNSGNYIISQSNSRATISGNSSGNYILNNTTGEWQFRANGSSVNSVTINSTGVTINENLTLPEYIYHSGDTDTYLRFQDDVVDLYAGGTRFLTAFESTQDVLIVNEGGTDVDFRVESNNNANMLFVDGGNDRVSIGIANPDATLEIFTGSQGTYLKAGADDAAGGRSLTFTSYTNNSSVGAGHTINALSTNGQIQLSTNGVVRTQIDSVGVSGSFLGDGSRLTGITASIIPTTTVSESFSGVNTYTVNHELESKEVIVQVYDSNDNVIVPSNIQVPTTESVILTFASNRSGRVVVARAGHVVSGSSSGGISGGTGVTVSGGVVSIGQAVGTADDLQFDSLGVGTAASGVTGEIRATNDVTAFYSSDERLKDNITPIQGSLDKVAQLGGYEFDWIPKEGIHSHEGHDIGVIAQEVEAVFPELVTTRDNGYKAVQYEKLTAVLLQAVKELTARVEELEKKQ